eukprot:CAMPEP_0170744642 /NCGR_PEP_ID=MMETSP0437-20130122/7886_1 /TAXON_ID=0 /ORGANISM="Sexangularia sp." /LENGTH=411 /DNA_ID=CAMNT_0011083343 /DNA_START=53 /DNA_END=1288 /DNA_ORIENTATION=-
MFLQLLSLASLSFAISPDTVSSYIGPVGVLPTTVSNSILAEVQPVGTTGVTGVSSIIAAGTELGDGSLFGSFFVDGEAVICDVTQDPPCLPRENKQRPYLPTGVVMEPIRTNFGHMKATLRYDVIQVNEDATAAEPGFVAIRSLLALSNPTHVTRHVDVAFGSLFPEDEKRQAAVTIVTTSNGDDVIDDEDFYALALAEDAYVLIVQHSDCTEGSHHYQVKQNGAIDGIDEITLGTKAKVMVHEDHVSIVAQIVEVFPIGEGTDAEALALANDRIRSLNRRKDFSDLHWFGDLTDKERLAIVNHCVDDDDGEDSDDDDSSSSDSSISTSDYEGSAFNFEFHEEKCDNPIYSDKAIRYKDDFSSEFSSSKIYTSTVDRISDPSDHKDKDDSDKHHSHHEHKSNDWAAILEEA